MSAVADIGRSLIEVDDCVLVVIDIQDGFLDKYDNLKTQTLLAKVVWLLHVADHLGVPVVAMGEDMENVGDINPRIREALPESTRVHDKDFFNLADNPEILADVRASGRGTAVCVGMETDVCVAQSALGLIENGFQVVALRDAVATTEADEEIGLARMRGAGVVISSVKALYYEWLRSVSRCAPLRGKLRDLRPASLVL